MTVSEMADHKVKIEKVMINHLTALGYPDISDQQIINEVKNMWIKLEEANLVVEGMNFQSFSAHAQQAFMLNQMMGIFGI